MNLEEELKKPIKNSIKLPLLNSECGFSSSLNGEQTIKTICVTGWDKEPTGGAPVQINQLLCI